MNKTSKFILIVLLTLAMLFPSIVGVKAVEDEEDYRAEFSLTTNNVNVKVGDEVSVNINIVSVTGFKGIATFNAKKVFDSSIFDYMGSTPASGWNVTADDVKIVVNSGETHTSGTIATMKFKVKKEIADTVIQLTELDAGGDDFEGEAAGVCYKDNNVNAPSVGFKVTTTDPTPENPTPENPTPENPAPENPTPENPTPENPTPENPAPENPAPENPAPEKPTSGTNQGSNNNSSANNNSTNKNDKTTAKGNKIPQTGEPYMVIITLVATITLAGGLFVKYKLFSNKIK